jgi:outer membrane protein insertion porin family
VRFGFPIGEDDAVSFGLSYDSTKITLFDDSPLRYREFVREVGDNPDTLLTTLGWSKDTRDSFTWPTRGSFQRVLGELGLPGATLTYYRLAYQFQHYFPISRDYALYFNTDLGYADGYDNVPLPFFKNFFAGGIGSVRGYETASLGPKDLEGNAVGGNRKIVGNLEFLFPIPGMGQDRSVRLGVFGDAGQVWAPFQTLSLSDLRYSAGLSVAWNSPLGPLKFSFAEPLNAKSGDQIQRFQFQFGTIF